MLTLFFVTFVTKMEHELVFAMQAAGLIAGPLFASALLAANISRDIAWRILVAFGAVPALAVYWARRHLKPSFWK